ncbi:dephospho-CoA kinase [Sporolactobacillus sp. STCC-11]|uniref:dephospho-CoA kinase n=1 Tax=Sporolactobacillus caesalpiniae TaxID=3230362 RepID=UPI003390EAB7
MMKIGLTGGIASGKSTISRWLIHHGYSVIDADKISREVVAAGQPALCRISDKFGDAMILPTGELDRKQLASLIFQDDKKRAALNALLHPLIRSWMLKELDQYEKEGASAAFLDIPLLYESGLASWVDKTIVVYVSETNQLKRLMARNHLDESQARARMGSQIPLSEKVKLADAVIDNNGSIEETEAQLQRLLQRWSLEN